MVQYIKNRINFSLRLLNYTALTAETGQFVLFSITEKVRSKAQYG